MKPRNLLNRNPEDALLQVSKELSVSKCEEELFEMVSMIRSRLGINQEVIKINNQEAPHKWLKNMGHESYKSTRGVG